MSWSTQSRETSSSDIEFGDLEPTAADQCCSSKEKKKQTAVTRLAFEQTVSPCNGVEVKPISPNDINDRSSVAEYTNNLSAKSIQNYVLELHRIARRFSECGSKTSITLSLEVTKFTEIDLPVPTPSTDLCHHDATGASLGSPSYDALEQLINTLPGQTSESLPGFYNVDDEDDSDSLIVFQCDDAGLSPTTQSLDNSTLKVKNKSITALQSPLGTAATKNLRVPYGVGLTFTKHHGKRQPPSILIIEMRMPFLSDHPEVPPFFSVLSTKHISSQAKNVLISELKAGPHRWRAGRYNVGSIELSVDHIVGLLSSLPLTKKTPRHLTRSTYRRANKQLICNFSSRSPKLQSSLLLTSDPSIDSDDAKKSWSYHSNASDFRNNCQKRCRKFGSIDKTARPSEKIQTNSFPKQCASFQLDSKQKSLSLSPKTSFHLLDRKHTSSASPSSCKIATRPASVTPVSHTRRWNTFAETVSATATYNRNNSALTNGVKFKLVAASPGGLLSAASSDQWAGPGVPHSSSEKYETSRYFRNFVELELLGVGAFGSVTRCRLRIAEQNKEHKDAVYFAIKRIVLSPNSEKQNLILQREAANLAALRHTHIVRYYCAWIEPFSAQTRDYIRGSTQQSSSYCARHKDKNQLCSPEEGYFKSHASFTISCDPATSSSRILKSQRRSISMFPQSVPKTVIPTRCLYIQMEYCSGQSLRKAIDSGALYNRPGIIWTLFHQILDGLACMHANGLIHRDLKPCNIFLQNAALGGPVDIHDADISDILVKIGDFGLTTSIHERRTGKAPLQTSYPVFSDLSAGVGTKFYMAPEQERGGTYNDKADMFSLGVVFFELWSPPFKTAMERAIVLSKLLSQERELPSEFLQSVPAVVPIILFMLLNDSPDDRPSAQSLLQSMLVPPVPAKGKFQTIYMSLARSPFSAEAAQITDALFRAQLLKQIHFEKSQIPNFAETRFLPSSERASWTRNQSLTEVSIQLVCVFTLRRALRFECPVVLPRLEKFASVFSTIDSRAMTDSTVPLPTDFHRQTVLLDRYGTPVYVPNRLISGFAKTAVSFLMSFSSVARRFAIGNVHCGPTPSTTEQPSDANFPEHFHALYDIGIKLSALLEPDVASSFSVSTSSAARNILNPYATAMFLAYLFRSPTLSSRDRILSNLRSCLRLLISYPIFASFELEVVAVTLQALGAVVNNTGLESSFQYTLYWTHGLLLSSLLWDIAKIPVHCLASLELELRWKDPPWTKNYFVKILSSLLSTLTDKKSGAQNANECPTALSSSKNPDYANVESLASLLHTVFSYEDTLQNWVSKVQRLLHTLHGKDTVTVTGLLLQHILYLNGLISTCVAQPAVFVVTLPFDVSVYGKGFVFLVSKLQFSHPMRSQDTAYQSTEEDNYLATDAAYYNGVPSGKLQFSPKFNHGIGASIDTWKHRTGIPSFVATNVEKRALFRNRIAIGGRYDFFVSGLCGQSSGFKDMAFFASEISVGLLVDFVSCKMKNVCINSGTSQPPGCRAHCMVFDSERKTELLLPQVLVVVSRTELQIHAVSLRRRLLHHGIPCQRRFDRVADNAFRRRTKSISGCTWIVQIKTQTPLNVLYKLQYCGPQGVPGLVLPDTTVTLDTEDKVLDYLVPLFHSLAQKSGDA